MIGSINGYSTNTVPPAQRRGPGPAAAAAPTLTSSDPSDSLDFWIERLSTRGIAFSGPGSRFGQRVITFEDPDGMAVELFPDASVDKMTGWTGSAVGPRHAVRRFHGATFTQRELGPARSFLTDVMGFTPGQAEDNRHRFLAGDDESQARIDILVDSRAPQGRQSAGTVHHIAWRVKDDQEQLEWRSTLISAGVSPTPVIDRSYFHSIYFREPGGVLFEIATDPPGFSVDEPVGTLGTRLKLPPWLETERPRIERHLPPISIPAPRSGRCVGSGVIVL